MGWFDRPEFGPNVGLIDDIYRRYLQDPTSVSPAWREFFAEQDSEDAPVDVHGPGRSDGRRSTAPEDRGDVAAKKDRPGAASGTRTTPPANGRPAAGRDPAGRDTVTDRAQAVPLKGMGARIVEAMETSLEVPTATSLRVVPARLLEVNRNVLNGHLRRTRRGKVSFTHLIGYAVVRALAAVPAMRTSFGTLGGKPHAVPHEHVNLGLAVDVKRPDGSRGLIVPNIKDADTFDFAAFLSAYERLVRKVRVNQTSPDDMAGTTVTLTNPGMIGTVSSVPRLMRGQAAIIGVGSIDYPAEYQGADPARLAELGVGKVVTLTSTYDHRVVQGAESGEFLTTVHRLLLGEDGFYDDVFASLNVPYVPVRWQRDENDPADQLSHTEKQARVLQLINMYRVRGHLLADLDPLALKPPRMHPELNPEHYGFTAWDLERTFVTNGLGGQREQRLSDILRLLRDAYCQTASCEYMHISETEEKRWIQERVERAQAPLDEDRQGQVLHKLGEAEAFERFLQNKYTGSKRFSLEGAESLIPLLDTVLDEAADAGVAEVVMGMAHRGRLNVLANTVGKSYQEIFSGFEGRMDPANPEGTGDVKYHLGASGKHTSSSGRELAVSLASNPSHLESVNPVVEGIVRARQDLLRLQAGDGRRDIRAEDSRHGDTRIPPPVNGTDGEPEPVLPLLIHGDAAFAGQGVVAETLNLSQLAGYHTGGTIHVVVNNQLGFTTSPDYSRSSTYATDVAKMIQAPIWHVNGDDPEAVVRVARLAFAYRQAFGKDAVIDMWCYRRWGHNETDEPSFTQPIMYGLIRGRRSVRKLYTQELVERGDLSVEGAERALEAFQGRLQSAFEEVKEDETPAPTVRRRRGRLEGTDPRVTTAVPMSDLRSLSRQLTTVPDGFDVHPKLTKWLAGRAGAVDTDEPTVDWSLAEALAFGSLLADGRTIRLTGQDTRRGTFSHRHAALVDQRTGQLHIPLAHVEPGTFYVEDSLLSEFAAMGFEYGYSVGNPDALVLWEAQFGDFVNGAQIIIDQFLVAAEDKWAQRSGLVLLLPHGYEGQGPEHSSSRVERFLTLAANENIQVAVPSTSGQYFHLLRRQALRGLRKPLVVLTPKSLLRQPAAFARGTDLARGTFEPVLDDPAAPAPEDVRRVLLCSGKIGHELLRRRNEEQVQGATVLRVEQLYPLPTDELRRRLAGYPDNVEVVWVQEEPENMGAWRFLRLAAESELGLRLERVSRAASAAPATGSSTIHASEQAQILRDALAGLPRGT